LDRADPQTVVIHVYGCVSVRNAARLPMLSLRGALRNLPRRSLLPNAMRLRNALSCAVAWCIVVIPCRRFGTTSRSHFEGSSVRTVLRYTSKCACNLIHLCKYSTTFASLVFKKLYQQHYRHVCCTQTQSTRVGQKCECTVRQARLCTPLSSVWLSRRRFLQKYHKHIFGHFVH
jgi:hypothetical protein